MPLDVGPKGVDDGDDAHAHAVLVPGPLVQATRPGTRQDRQADLAVEGHDRPQLPRSREHEMVVGNVDEVVEHRVGPAVGGVLAARGAEARIARTEPVKPGETVVSQ
jgi:hypothetical protein